jgi:hypothetical protein
MEAGYAQRMSAGTVAKVVFLLLVAATAGAFFVTQRLKRSTPVVKRLELPLYVSPNGDGRKDVVRLAFFLPKRDRVTVAMVDSGGDEVRRLADDRLLRRGRHEFKWNGRDNAGHVAPDGEYPLRVIVREEGRATTTRRGIRVLTKPPKPRLLSVTPARAAPGARTPVTVRFTGPSSPPAQISVYRTDVRPAKLVRRFAAPRGEHTATWSGTDDAAKPVPPGTYAFGVTVQNKGLVAGSAPRKLPPASGTASPRTGLTISGPSATPPLEPVRAGSIARVALTGASGRVRWSVAAVGATRPLRRGKGRSPLVGVRLPRDTPTGLYLVRLRSRTGRVVAPLVVRGRRTGRVLVVLPAITWQGLNPVDTDADGFPDTLDNGTSIAVARPFANGRPPLGFGAEAALLRFLGERRLRYDLTTDLALARGHGPRLAGRPGVVFAGSERWFTEALDGQLRDYVEGGGKVASFGTDSFRRTVAVTERTLADPSKPQQTNVLGEQTSAASSAAAPLVVGSDTLGLFSGTDGYVGLFTQFEQSQARVGGASVVAAAGRDPQHPAFVAYRLGQGLVVRAGTPEWNAALASESEVSRVTANLWSLLSR